MKAKYLLAIDQGTSSSRAVVYGEQLDVIASAQQEFAQIYPRSGWVEHDPEAIWSSVVDVCRQALGDAGLDAAAVAATGITNQRETTVVWERETGRPVHNAIVWQDRRTADRCRSLRDAGHEATVSARTGLRLDPYFSATKLGWILDNVAGARERAERGELAFGTIDSFLIWRLTGGRVHATDATNASRTMLFDIHRQQWDPELLELLGIPAGLLPEVKDCAADYGATDAAVLGAAIPISGVAGDQQAALIGQAGFDAGLTKSTYGTGLFAITNTGGEVVHSGNQLLSTVAYRLDGEVTFGLEGSVFVAGSAVQWLRDELRLVDSAAATEAIAKQTGIVDDVVVVPAFAGLGAPYWDPDARGAIVGLSRGSNREQLVTATLQAVALQTCDLIDAMAEDGVRPSTIRVDGGMAANDWFLQFLADVADVEVERPVNVESTVLGAASLAGLGSGLVDSVGTIRERWQLDRRFGPDMRAERRDALRAGWRAAVGRVRSGS